MRHATAAYAALTQGAASKRRTRSFDMAALPSVPELNASQMPSQMSQEVGAGFGVAGGGLGHVD